MIKRQTSLSANIVQFCRFLRLKGFALGVEEETTALQALALINYSDRRQFALTLKSVCCRNRIQQENFDSLFNEYWKELDRAVDASIKTSPKRVNKPPRGDASFKSLQAWMKGNRTEEIEETAAYSIQETLSQKDFSSVPETDLAELTRSIRALSKKLAAQLSRRYQKSGNILLPDLRRTLRKNMRYGGELLQIAFRKRRRTRTRLVILCDVSQSMDLYTAFLLQFMFAFQQVYSRIETFAFGTSLQRVTAHLKQDDFKEALSRLGEQNSTWGGGTRIGESLQQFVTGYAPRLLNKHTIVIILSDGWDTGNIELVGESMKYIHARSKKVIWLNPLANSPVYQPSAAGMLAAMEHIDVFAPVNNLDSLKRLARRL
jgi:uncharacterized protein with von Willebrand factor type A (vWA) domain